MTYIDVVIIRLSVELFGEVVSIERRLELDKNQAFVRTDISVDAIQFPTSSPRERGNELTSAGAAA